MFYVYVLQSKKSRELYIGYSNDLKRRLDERNKRQNTATKFKAPFQLVYYEAYRDQADAKEREKQLKRHGGATTHLKRRIARSLE